MKFNFRLLFLVVSFTVVSILILFHAFYGIFPYQWTMSQPFSDIKGLLGAADCKSAGLDPYLVTSFDPWGRTLNYPKIWLSIFNFFHLTMSSANLLGFTFILLYTTTTIFIFKIKKNLDLILVLLLIFSPPILLLLERGNLDIIIYLLIILSVFFIRKIKTINPILQIHLTYLIILFTFFLKIYPVVLLSLLIFENISGRNFILITAYSLTILIIYFFSSYTDIVFIFNNTPRPGFIAYGRNILLQLYFNGKILVFVSGILIAITLGLAIFICVRFKKKLKEIIPISYAVKDNIFLFLSGAIIYAGTFIHGNNYDYKLVFLLLTIPYLLDIWKGSQNKTILFASIYSIFFAVFFSSFLAEFFYAYSLSTT